MLPISTWATLDSGGMCMGSTGMLYHKTWCTRVLGLHKGGLCRQQPLVISKPWAVDIAMGYFQRPCRTNRPVFKILWHFVKHDLVPQLSKF